MVKKPCAQSLKTKPPFARAKAADANGVALKAWSAGDRDRKLGPAISAIDFYKCVASNHPGSRSDTCSPFYWVM
jgi:hypothetical protein